MVRGVADDCRHNRPAGLEVQTNDFLAQQPVSRTVVTLPAGQQLDGSIGPL